MTDQGFKIRSLTAVAAILVLLGSGAALVLAESVDTAHAAPTNHIIDYDFDSNVNTYTMYAGDNFSIRIYANEDDGFFAAWWRTTKYGGAPGAFPSWITVENGYIDGTITASNIPQGTYVLPTFADSEGGYLNGTLTLKVLAPLHYMISFNSNGGSNVASKTVSVGESYGTLPMPSKSGYTFAGWYDGATKVSASTKPTKDTTLTAQWTANNIQYSAHSPQNKLAVGMAWSHLASTTPNVSITVTGVSWLTSNGGTISGIPTDAGTYEVTLVLTAPNHISLTKTVTLDVVPMLELTNSPASGAIAYVLL